MKRYKTEEEDKIFSHDRSKFDELFGRGNYRELALTNTQTLDWTALHGKILSYSYSPLPGHPLYEPMVNELHRYFTENQVDGVVSFEYSVTVFVGKNK